MNITLIKQSAVLVLIALALNGCNKTIPVIAPEPAVTVQPGATVTSKKVSNLERLGDPDSVQWLAIQEYQVDLSAAPPVHPSVMLRMDLQALPVPLSFKMASDDTDFKVLLRWPDTSQNVENSFEKFSDGAAIQFALSGGDQTSYMMGTSGAPVNIWYWKSNADEAQNLNAGGFGSTTHSEHQTVTARSSYSESDGEWRVVLSGPLNPKDAYQANLTGDTPILVSFAVWQGEDKQRNGAKYVTLGWLNVEQAERL